MRRQRSTRLLLGVTLLAAVLSLCACGGASTRSNPPTRSSTTPTIAPVDSHESEPNAIIVRIPGHNITKEMFAHELRRAQRLREPNPAPLVPPDFAACVDQAKATSQSTAVEALRGGCKQRYETLETTALGRLITASWVRGAASELGMRVNARALARELAKADGRQSHGEAERELEQSGRTLADFIAQLEVQQLAEGIRQKIASGVGRITHTQVVAYYKANKSHFGSPHRRDLEIARMATETEARKVKAELASGQSFAKIVKTLPLRQPIFSKEGLVRGLAPGTYREPPLDKAIFNAKANTLVGPVKISLGYYVIEVKRIIPATHQPLARVERTIKKLLPEALYQERLVAFIKQWRAKWTDRTDCRAGYVVHKCRQFKPPPGQVAEEDPYSLT